MFDFLQDHLERDVIKQAESSIQQIEHVRRLNKTYYAFHLITGIFSFIILIFCYHIFSKNGGTHIAILATGTATVGAIILIDRFLGKKPHFLNFLSTQYLKAKYHILCKIYDDLFYLHFVLLLIFIYLPIVIFVIVAIFPPSTWIMPSPNEINSIELLMSFSLAILGGQLTLFVFMFGNLIGKYSSRIAIVIIHHKIMLCLLLYPIISLSALWIYYTYGLPITIQAFIAPTLFIFDIICLVFTVLVCFTGIHTERVFMYVGTYASRRIKKTLAPPLYETKGLKKLFWDKMAVCGLDWRDSERIRPFEPPRKAVLLCREYLRGFFNAANKSIQENNEGLLYAVLYSIIRTVAAYIKQRASYHGSHDVILSYCNDQMSALLKAASKSSNEYMITDVIKNIGTIGWLSLDISERYDEIDDNPVLSSPKRHRLSLSWIGLLQEGFILSHSLMRSTAASEVITQLRYIALKTLYLEYDDDIRIGFLEKTKEVHVECLKNPDAYHLSLASDCIQNILYIWYASTTRKKNKIRSDFHLHGECSKIVIDMAQLQFIFKQSFYHNLNGPVNILISKVDKDNYILQDIFYVLLHRSIVEDWEIRTTLSDLEIVIDSIVSLTIKAIEKNALGYGSFSEALYEVGYLVLRGMPSTFTISTKSKPEDTYSFMQRERESPQERLQRKILDSWRNLLLVFFKEEYPSGRDWIQNFFGILGIALLQYYKNRNEKLKSEIVLCVNLFKKEVITNKNSKCSLKEDGWNYMQLLGAWIGYFLEDAKQAEEIAQLVAENKSFFREGLGFSSSQRFAIIGYPEVMLHADFFLPWLRNLQPQKYLSEAEWNEFRKWQNEIMDENMLQNYYRVVEKYRSPLRKAYYEKIREIRQKRKEID